MTRSPGCSSSSGISGSAGLRRAVPRDLDAGLPPRPLHQARSSRTGRDLRRPRRTAAPAGSARRRRRCPASTLGACRGRPDGELRSGAGGRRVAGQAGAAALRGLLGLPGLRGGRHVRGLDVGHRGGAVAGGQLRVGELVAGDLGVQLGAAGRRGRRGPARRRRWPVGRRLGRRGCGGPLLLGRRGARRCPPRRARQGAAQGVLAGPRPPGSAVAWSR